MQVKTLLAVFVIVIAVEFVAADSIIPQASAQFVVCKNGEVFNGGCPPGLGAGPAKSSAPGQQPESGGPGHSEHSPGHINH